MDTELFGDIFIDNTNKFTSAGITVIGVGGGGSNAANHMYRKGINGVDFIVSNTDLQALRSSPIPKKIQLGKELTEGWGAGNKPEIGKLAAMENIDEVKSILVDDTKMVFIAAGMGGGTGTGASPIIAKLFKDLEIITVGIVTLPFRFEGANRNNMAIDGVYNLQKYVDTLIIIDNQKIINIYGELPISKAFAKADEMLNVAAKCIADITTVNGNINVEMSDIETIIKDSGVAIIGSANAFGDDRAEVAINKALASPLLLNNSNIMGAKNVLLSITSGKDFSNPELNTITSIIKRKAGNNVEINSGNIFEDKMKGSISLTFLATGFELNKKDKLISFKEKDLSAKTSNFEFVISNPDKIERKPQSVNDVKNDEKRKQNKTMQNLKKRIGSLFDYDDSDMEME